MKKVKKEQNTPVKPVENPAADIEQLNQARQEALAQVDVLTADLQRTRADFENFRKQVELQKTQAQEATRFATVAKVLPLLDDLQRAIATYPEQLQPLQKPLEKTLQELQLSLMDTNEGVDFNPDFHEAVMVEDGDGEHEVIAETLRPGYLYEGQVLRPAMVKVKRV